MRELSVSDYCCEKCGDVNQGTVYDTNVSDLRLCQSCYAALCEGKQFPYPWRYWFVKCEPPHCGCPVEEIQVEEVEHIDADPLASKRLRASNRAKNAVWNDCPTVEAVVSITGERKVCQCGEIFYSQRSTGKYCSTKCRQRFNYKAKSKVLASDANSLLESLESTVERYTSLFMRVSGHSRHFDAKDTNGGKLAKSIGRVGILRDGTRVTVRQVERVLSKVPKIVAVSWHDRSGSGAQVYRLVDGRMILAGFCQLTDETVEVSTPRKKAIVEESVEESDDSVLSTETDAVEEPEEIAELTLPRFSSVAALEDAEVPDTQPGEESEDSGEEVEEETEVA